MTGYHTILDTLGFWRVRVACRLLGHKWGARVSYMPGGITHVEGNLCARCYTWRRP